MRTAVGELHEVLEKLSNKTITRLPTYPPPKLRELVGTETSEHEATYNLKLLMQCKIKYAQHSITI